MLLISSYETMVEDLTKNAFRATPSVVQQRFYQARLVFIVAAKRSTRTAQPKN